MVCTKEGGSVASEDPDPMDRNRGTKREGCKAGLKLHKHLGPKKEVTSVTVELFDPSHKHPMLTK